MRIIEKYVDQIAEELESAQNYAESYIECKVENDMTWANKYKEMANQELTHAMNIHERASTEITKLNAVLTAPISMQETWEKSHKEWVEKTAWIKLMLTM